MAASPPWVGRMVGALGIQARSIFGEDSHESLRTIARAATSAGWVIQGEGAGANEFTPEANRRYHMLLPVYNGNALPRERWKHPMTDECGVIFKGGKVLDFYQERIAGKDNGFSSGKLLWIAIPTIHPFSINPAYFSETQSNINGKDGNDDEDEDEDDERSASSCIVMVDIDGCLWPARLLAPAECEETAGEVLHPRIIVSVLLSSSAPRSTVQP